MKTTVYDIVTEKLIERLEKGVCPWRKTWNPIAAGAPANLVSKKAYRGINNLLLSLEETACPWYVSFNQCKALGGKVKKGASGKVVTFFKVLKFNKPGEAGDTGEAGEESTGGKRWPLLRYYRVFNALDDCEGLESRIPASVRPADFNPIELAWSKVKTILRRLRARTLPDLIEALKLALQAITPQDIHGWFAHCGYAIN